MTSAADQRALLEPIHLPADALYVSLNVLWSSAVPNHSISSKFFLDIAQQPVRSRMSGVGEKSMFFVYNRMLTFVLDNRRPIGISAIRSCGSFADIYVDPPPAVKLRVIGPDGMELQLYVPYSPTFVDTPSSQIETMSLFLTVTLTDIHGNLVRIQNREHQMTPLVGVTNTSFHRITMPRSDNEHLQDVIPVFAFTDLSVRQEGIFKLRFNLFEITNGMSIHRAEAFSLQFQVFSAKNFPGMEPSTPFTETLKKHGLRVRVSKSIRTAKSQARALKMDPIKGPDHDGLNIGRHNGYQPYNV